MTNFGATTQYKPISKLSFRHKCLVVPCADAHSPVPVNDPGALLTSGDSW